MNGILIVDDALFMRSVIRKMLTKAGYEILGEAEDGEQGIRMFTELNPPIVSLDLTMPKVDGIQMLKSIKAINPNVKVVAVSAMGQEFMIKRAIEAGVDAFIVKPFKEDAYLGIIKSMSKGMS